MSVREDYELSQIFNDAFKKYRRGSEKHGELCLDTDKRDFLCEAEMELLDAIVYLGFEVAKIRRRKNNED